MDCIVCGKHSLDYDQAIIVDESASFGFPYDPKPWKHSSPQIPSALNALAFSNLIKLRSFANFECDYAFNKPMVEMTKVSNADGRVVVRVHIA